MNLPAAIDPAVLFIGVIAISIINAIVKAVRGKSEAGQEERPDSVRPARSGESEEERMRKFMEALGVPTEPPKPLPPVLEVERPAPPPVATPKPTGRRFTPPIGPAPSFPREAMTRLPRETNPPPMPTAPMVLDEATTRLAKKFTAAANYGIAQSDPLRTPNARSATTPAALAALLRDPAEQRKAIILREIFGPCRGLQSLP